VTSTATVAPPAANTEFDDRHTHTTLWHVIRSEWTKIWSVRSTFWTLLTLIVVTIGLSTLFAWGASANLDKMDPVQRAQLDVTSNAMGGLLLGQLAIAVLGCMVITAEYSTRGIKTTFTAVPQRLRVVVAKGLVFAVVSFVTGLIVAFGSYFIAMIFWSRHGLATNLGQPHVLRAVIGGALYVLASGMFGFAFGTLLRHTGGAIATVVGLLFVAPLLTGLLPGTWGDKINRYFTSNAGQHITDVIHVPGVISPWLGYLTLTIWWLVPLIIGAVLIQKRDA